MAFVIDNPLEQGRCQFQLIFGLESRNFLNLMIKFLFSILIDVDDREQYPIEAGRK
jgi:hypothetical protein